MPDRPPELEKAPAKWKQAFKQLADYAVATSLQKVIVNVHKSDGSVVPANVSMQRSADGIIVSIDIPP